MSQPEEPDFIFFGKIEGQAIAVGHNPERVGQSVASKINPRGYYVEASVEGMPVTEGLTFDRLPPKGVKRPGPSFMDRFR